MSPDSPDPDAAPLEPPAPDEAVGPHEPAAVALRHNVGFRLLWVGQVLSDLGSEFGAIAYPLLVLALTGSPVIAGAVGTITSAVAFGVRLPAGALADRLDRRRTMIACDAIRAVVLGVFAVLVVTDAVVWPLVLGVAIVDRVGDTLFTPASTALLPRLVAPNQLEDAWAATEARQYGAALGGPALGGILYTIGRAVPFVGDTVSYGVSAITSWRIRGDFATTRDAETSRGLWAEAFDGVRYVWRSTLLRAVVLQAPLINFAFTGILFSVTLALRHDGKSAATIGVTQSAIMLGGLLGAIAAPRFQGRMPMSRLIVIVTALGTVCFAAAAVLVPSPLLAIPIGLALFLSPAANAALFGTLLRETPEAMRGRVNNALLQAATGLAALAPLVAGLMIEHVSSHAAMALFAAVLGVSTVIALTSKGLRLAERPAP